MDSMTLIAVASIVTAGITIGVGCFGPAMGQGRAVSTALSAVAQQPDAAPTITRKMSHRKSQTTILGVAVAGSGRTLRTGQRKTAKNPVSRS